MTESFKAIIIGFLYSFKMEKSWFWTCILIIGLFPALLFANGPVHTHIFRDGDAKKLFFHDSLYVLVDHSTQWGITDILKLSESEFKRPSNDMELSPPFAVWSKLVLKNESSSTLHYYFSFCSDVLESRVYTFSEGRLINEQVTGKQVKPSHKSIPSVYYYLPVSIDPGAEKEFYFRFYFDKMVGVEHFSHIEIQPAKPLLNRLFNSYIIHSIYAGVMLFFCVFSLFLYFLFKEKIFVYFATLTLLFGFYFTHLQGMIDGFVTNWFELNNISLGNFIISGLLISLFLFVSGYVRLKDKLPKFYAGYLLFTIVVIIYTLLSVPFGMGREIFMISHNLLIVVWSFLMVYSVVYLSIKKEKEAKVFLISIGILFLSVVVYLLSFSNANPEGTWMHFSFQLGTVAFSGILFYGLFDKISSIRKEQRRMTELDKLKSNFFANISHEFRTPLTLMMGPLDEVIKSTEDPKNLRLLDMAKRNADRQLDLVNQLLELSKLDAGKMELQAAEEDFVPFLKGVVHAYQSLAEQKQIDLILECSVESVPLYFSRDKMEKIFFNLLSNAFKFTPFGGKVSVALKTSNNTILIKISDTGVGISEEKLPFIFDRFFQADYNNNSEFAGSGIGLALVRELVQLHGGSISVVSKEGQGSTFTLSFMLGKAHLSKGSIVSSTPHNESLIVPSLSTSLEEDPFDESVGLDVSSNDLPRLLVIEDNTDVRTFIRMRLEHSFQIIEATNGQEGIDKAMELMPDLIISDVMMPEKDGFEVCHALKSDLRTCHIPIILLTAMAAQEEKLEGLGTGADDYLTKPFDSEELELRALNLIRLRRQLKQRFANSITIKPSDLATNSLDQSFLEDLLQIVEANLANDQFDIEMLTKKIGMSRSTLNRKLRALINQSINQFIQSVRLQRASELLLSQAGTVSEIAFQTGFGSTAYFIKCFKEQYGQTPGAFLKKE